MKPWLVTMVASAALLVLGVSVLLPATVQAVDILTPACSGAAAQTDVCKQHRANDTTKNPIIAALKVAIAVLSVIIGVGSTIVIILSGFRMVTANGDSQKVASARNGVLYALVGVAVAVLSGSLVAFVLNKI